MKRKNTNESFKLLADNLRLMGYTVKTRPTLKEIIDGIWFVKLFKKLISYL